MCVPPCPVFELPFHFSPSPLLSTPFSVYTDILSQACARKRPQPYPILLLSSLLSHLGNSLLSVDFKDARPVCVCARACVCVCVCVCAYDCVQYVYVLIPVQPIVSFPRDLIMWSKKLIRQPTLSIYQYD